MTYFNPVTNSGNSFSIKYDNLNLLFIAYIFVSGMISISAMVLPGISGSTILLIFGLYAPILNAIKQVLGLNLDYLPAIMIFGVGVLVGVLVTVRTVRSLLRKFRAGTIYCRIGLMIGSTYAVIMGSTSLEIPRPPMDASTFNIVFFIIGCTLVPDLEKLKTILKNKNIESENLEMNYYDEQGHSVELTVKDANSKIVENTKKFMTPGKYTYQFTVDGVSSPVYTYTVKEPPVYELLKEGKNLVALNDENLPACDYYEFVPESDGFYRIKTVYGALIDVYYMDENKSYHSVDWVNRSAVFGLTKGRTYYIGLDRADAEEFDNPNGEKSITITKIAEAECEWSDPVVKTPATCGKDGVAVETCKLHGDTRTITIPATGKHSYKWKVVKAPTAVAVGKKVQQCSVCGKTGSTQTIAKLKATITLNAGVNKTIPLKVKQSFQAKATGLAKGDKVVSWTSSNAKIATVSKTGKVVGKKAGTAMITVKLQSGLKANFKVKVQKTDVATTSLKVVNKATGKTLKSATLKLKKPLTLVTTVAPATSKQKVTYTSSNKKVATVSAKGVITARKKGKTTITVKSGKKAVKIQVTVK